MGGIPRLHHTMYRDCTNIVARKGAIVGNINDTHSFLREQSRKLRQPARTITNRRREAKQAAIRCQPALDDPAEQIQINIPAAQWQHDLLTLQLRHKSREARCQRRSASTLDYCL